jgi:toxin ParE1/3/4
MPKLRFSRDARDDLKELAEFIARDKPMAARRWVKRVKEKCHLLARNPKLGDPREDLGANVRCSYVGSYVIFFRHVGDHLDISRVIRGDRDIKSL